MMQGQNITNEDELTILNLLYYTKLKLFNNIFFERHIRQIAEFHGHVGITC